jgi:hypothetical protein
VLSRTVGALGGAGSNGPGGTGANTCSSPCDAAGGSSSVGLVRKDTRPSRHGLAASIPALLMTIALFGALAVSVGLSRRHPGWSRMPGVVRWLGGKRSKAPGLGALPG